jgi:hypothetical protein
MGIALLEGVWGGAVVAEPTASPMEVKIEEVLPVWVRGIWQYTTVVVEERGFGNLGRFRREELALPGDLAALYFTHYDNGEHLRRMCWEVVAHSPERFVFVERWRDRRDALLESTFEIKSVSPGMAALRQRIVVEDAGRWMGRKTVGGLFEASPGRKGAYQVRTAMMHRHPGSQWVQLSAVNLEKLRCHRSSENLSTASVPDG